MLHKWDRAVSSCELFAKGLLKRPPEQQRYSVVKILNNVQSSCIIKTHPPSCLAKLHTIPTPVCLSVCVCAYGFFPHSDVPDVVFLFLCSRFGRRSYDSYLICCTDDHNLTMVTCARSTVRKSPCLYIWVLVGFGYFAWTNGSTLPITHNLTTNIYYKNVIEQNVIMLST